MSEKKEKAFRALVRTRSVSRAVRPVQASAERTLAQGGIHSRRAGAMKMGSPLGGSPVGPVDKLEADAASLRADIRTQRTFEECLREVERQNRSEEAKYREALRRRVEKQRRTLTLCKLALVTALLAAVIAGALLTTPAKSREVPKPAVEMVHTLPEETREDKPTEISEEKQILENCRITFYCPCVRCCGKWADGVTASGVPAMAGVTVAVDPAVIPLGSRVYIEGKEYLAQDTGVSGAAVDVFMADHQAALEKGTFRTSVAFVPPGA